MAFTVRATGLGRVSVDAAEVRRALAVLADPAAGVQIQSLPTGRWEVVAGADLDAGVKAAESLSDGKGVYWSLNPCDPKRTEPIKASAMLARRWLLIDLDVDRPPDTNATDAEHDAAREVGGKVMDWLTVQGWPEPVAIDSGNGWHLLYRVDLPNDKLSQALVKRTIYAIADRFDAAAVKVDRAVHNANRISKLPGTLVRKGPLTDDRPHRMARLMFVPDEVQAVGVERLQQVAGLAKEPDAERPPVIPERRPLSPFKLVGRGDERARTNAYAKKALRYEALRLRLSTPGTRNTTANDAAFRCGTMVGAQWLLAQEVEAELLLAAHQCGLPTGEAADVIRRGLEAGRENPRPALAPKVAVNGRPVDPPHQPEPENGLLILRASEVRTRKVEWLWPGRVPIGKLTTFAGVGGLGKTFVLCDMTARITAGMDWPDSAGECCEQGQVLFVSGEDEPDDTLVPRMIEMGADLNRVAFLKTEVQDQFMLADLKTLDTAVEQIGDGVRLVVIDPPTAYLGGVDDHKNAELRGLLSPLKSWAAQRRVAVIFNTHVNKPQGAKVEAMMRVMGSVAWVNAVRAAHMFARDPEDHSRRLFVGMKLNIGKERKGLAYRLVEVGELAKVEWLGEVDTTADQAVNSDTAKPRRVVASEWLVERFREKREWPSDELFRAGREAHVSRDAIFEAKARLGLPRARKRVTEVGDEVFVWWVPDDWEHFGLSSQKNEPCDSCPSTDAESF